MLIRENIFDRQRVLSGILRSERFPRDIYPRLSLMIKDVNSLISHADFDSERLDYLQESTMSLINIEQNSIMRIFTVVTLIFMPPTLLTGIWGMNFDGLPWIHHRFGFWFSMLLMAGLVVGMFYYFRRKRWL
jgi:magnesium transporter